jgi:hypothetical protein
MEGESSLRVNGWCGDDWGENVERGCFHNEQGTDIKVGTCTLPSFECAQPRKVPAIETGGEGLGITNGR